MPILKSRGIATKLAKFNLRYGRGNGHLSFIINTGKLIVYYGAASYIVKDWFGFTLPKEVGIFGVLAYVVICYIVGVIDERVGFWRKEVAYATEELNPVIKEILDGVRELRKQHKEDEHKASS